MAFIPFEESKPPSPEQSIEALSMDELLRLAEESAREQSTKPGTSEGE
jgi:hypothetical protein